MGLFGRRESSSATQLLFAAVAANDPDRVQAALAAGADVEAVDEHGNSPLLKAVPASYGDGTVIALLRAAGADPYHANAYGRTPVEVARDLGEYDVAQFFADLPGHDPTVPRGTPEIQQRAARLRAETVQRADAPAGDAPVGGAPVREAPATGPMRLDHGVHGGEPEPVTSVEDLDPLFDEVGSPPRLVSLGPADGPFLDVGVADRLAVLAWIDEAAGEDQVAVGDRPAAGPLRFSFGELVVEFDAGAALAPDRARQAAADYLTTRRKPTGLNWRDR